MISGRVLYFILPVLALWFVALVAVLARVVSTAGFKRWKRVHLTALGLLCACVSVAALFAMYYSWTSPDVSQRFGEVGVEILAKLIFWPTVMGLCLGLAGAGKIRWVAIASCLGTGVWDLLLIMMAAASMSGTVSTRHPTRYLIPAGYVGLVTIRYGVAAPPLPMVNGEYVCRIPDTGVLDTSSAMENGWGSDEYFYYSGDGSLERLKAEDINGVGLVHGGVVSSTQGSKELDESFYIGTLDGYKRAEGLIK